MAQIPSNVQNFLDSITDPAKKAQAEQTFNSLVNSGIGLQSAFNAIKNTFGAMTSSARQFKDELNSSLDLAKAIVDALKNQEGPIVRAKKAMSGLVSIGQQLVDEERELDSISEKRLKQLNKEAYTKLKTFQIEAQNIAGRLGIQAKIEQNERRLLVVNNALANGAGKRAAKLAKQLEDELEILSAYKQQHISYEAIQKSAEKRYKLEQATTKTFGLTGAALAAMSTIASKLGVGHVSEQIDEIDKKLREEMRVEIEKNGGSALSFGKKFQYAARGIASTLRAIAAGMLDPLAIMGKIFDSFLNVNKAAVDYTRLSGINATNQAALNSRLATSVDYLETAAALTNQLGMSATSVFSNDDIAAMAEAKNLLGLTAEQAGRLGIRSKLANTNIDDFQDNLLKGVSAGNQLNSSLVAPGVAMQDILNVSEDVTMALGNNPEALGRASVAARAFGMSLQQVSDIAGTLLNFEDSISAELEAELMTGKSLNLERARELALTNDLEGLSKELAKNGATAAEFSKMNRLEQDALAKALGMNREQLAKSILAQEASKNATLEQRAAVMGVTKEQMQSMDIQERISKSLDKLAQAFAPILEALVPIAEVLVSAIQPMAAVVGYVASGLSSWIKPLLVIFGLYKGIVGLSQVGLAVNRAIYAYKAMQMGQEAFISREKGVQGIMEKQSLIARAAYNAQLIASLINEQGLVGLKTYALTLDEKSLARKIILNTYDTVAVGLARTRAFFENLTLGSIVAQTGALVANIGRGALLLAQTIARAVAALAAATAETLGIGTLPLLALMAAGAGVIYGLTQMKDGVIDPKKGPVMSGEFGSVQLDPNDKAMYGADGKIKVGTDLAGEQRIKAGATIPQTRPSAMANAARQTDSSSEIKQMRSEMSGLLKTLVNKTGDIYMDSNRVGKSLALGSYKSS